MPPDNTSERLVRLEETVKAHTDDLEKHGGTLDHIVNTMDSILLPTQKVHMEKLLELRTERDEDRKDVRTMQDYITGQKGAWALVLKAAVIIGASSSLTVLIMKILEYFKK